MLCFKCLDISVIVLPILILSLVKFAHIELEFTYELKSNGKPCQMESCENDNLVKLLFKILLLYSFIIITMSIS